MSGIMKYVILEDVVSGEKLPVVFSDELVHKDVAFGISEASARSDHRIRDLVPVSAGFVTVKDQRARAEGRSESLGLRSLEGDSELLTKFLT